MWRLPMAMMIAAAIIGALGYVLAVPFEDTWAFETLMEASLDAQVSAQQRQALAVPPGLLLAEFMWLPGLMLLVGAVTEGARRLGRLESDRVGVVAAGLAVLACFGAAVLATPPDPVSTVLGGGLFVLVASVSSAVVLVALRPWLASPQVRSRRPG